MSKKNAIRYALIFILSAAFILIFKGFLGSWANTLIIIGIAWGAFAIICIGDPEGAIKSPYDFPDATKTIRIIYSIATAISGLLFFLTIESLRDANWPALIAHGLALWLDALTLRLCMAKAEKNKNKENESEE